MKPAKKELQTYHTPQVTDYGNIKQITMTLGLGGRRDGSTVPNRKNTGV